MRSLPTTASATERHLFIALESPVPVDSAVRLKSRGILLRVTLQVPQLGAVLVRELEFLVDLCLAAFTASGCPPGDCWPFQAGLPFTTGDDLGRCLANCFDGSGPGRLIGRKSIVKAVLLFSLETYRIGSGTQI